MITSYIIAAIFALLSVPLFMGKGEFLIAGYNTMTPKEKEKYNKEHDIKKVYRSTGFLMLSFAALTAVIGYYSSQVVTLYCTATIIAIVVFFITYVNVGCKKY
ncbi:MAG: DUF3784 domain-containing protein [Clostridia bacterium]|nr:DUF3784 domain-containing protein [Clostridia bacterium]